MSAHPALRRTVRLLLAALLALVATLTAGAPAHADFGTDYHDPFTVTQPLKRPTTASCAVEVMHERQFRNGYGNPPDTPYVGQLTPPTACAGPWSKAVLDLHGQVAGRQFDRLFTVRVGGVEVMMSSTPEPSQDGIEWRVEHDLTRYAPLLNTPQPFEFDLANVTDSTYTGVFTVSATVTYYTADAAWPAPEQADRLLTTGAFSLTQAAPSAARDLVFPANLERLTAEVYARGGGACEEFAYASAPDDFVSRNPGLGYCGKGPFRELRLAVDGRVAGTVWPYPVIYTGGWEPLLWRPVPGIFAFDLPAYQVDLTPYVGLLLDGRPHSVSITVNQAEKQGNDAWTGQVNLFAGVDHGSARTTGALTDYRVAPEAAVSTTLDDQGGGSGAWQVTAVRHDLARGWVQTSHGRVATEVRSELSFRSGQQLRDKGNDLVLHNDADLTRTTSSWGGGPHRVHTVHEGEPLDVTYRSTSDSAGNSDQRTAMRLGYHRSDTTAAGARITARSTVDHTLSPSAHRQSGATTVRTADSTESYRATGPDGPYARTVTTHDGWPVNGG
ncbi:peptide-N4-asparagine amidase [Saccharothrix sp. ST-888]|uniref:peptide-N4-asparagine amidase n=1 Tax=Saccharothrix sp. ST-888 TaxID=1427391 RepID=UPI000696476A|nr:peptide-N4-asparagine amidase [Saccharothrix sp. ST-888]